MNNDLISRSELKKVFGYTDEWYKGRTVCAIIDNAPTEERPQGRWIKTQEDRWIYPICSECGYKENVVTNYCANCGAKMDKEGK